MIINNRLKKFLFLLIPIYVFIIALILGYPVFEANDDVFIMNILSGRYNGSPHASVVYINIILGYIISGLYKLVYLPWYPAFVIISILLGEIFICSLIYELILKKDLHPIIKAFVFITMLPIFIYITVYPTYTTAATMLGVISLYLLFKHKRVWSLVILILSVMLRAQSGIVACAFWGLSYIYLHFKNNKKITFKFILFGFLAVVLVLGVYFGDLQIKKRIEPEGYLEFRKEQAENYDYAKSWTPKEKKKIQSEIGFDDTLMTLVNNNYFSMDERVNTENLRWLNEYSYYKNPSLKRSANFIIYDILTNKFKLSIVFMYWATIFVFFVYSIRNKNRELWAFLSVIILSTLMHGVLILYEKTILRALLSVIMPALTTAYAILLQCSSAGEFKYGEAKKDVDIILFTLLCVFMLENRMIYSFAIMAIILIFAVFKHFNKNLLINILTLTIFVISTTYMFYNNFSLNIGEYTTKSWKNKGTIVQRVEDYIIEHNDNIYIYTGTIITDSRIIVPNYDISNMFICGDSYVHSAAHEIKMQRAGLEKFDISEFLKPNVYLVLGNYKTKSFNEKEYFTNEFSKLMNHRGFEGKFKVVDTIGDAANVLRFEDK